MYKIKFHICLVLFLLGLSLSCCNAQSTLYGLSFVEGKITIIDKQIDLEGNNLILPQNVTLRFEKGGCLRNGKIIANNAFIIGFKKDIFDNIKIAGRWNVKYISTDMFKDNSQLNSLQNVFALASGDVNNIISVGEGIYKVTANHNVKKILTVPSNTEVIINGKIVMLPNDLVSYSIIELKGENIQLHGKGEIIGDKYTHTSTKGEWGMGVLLSQCRNIDIYDLTIKDCWGDCIYVGSGSTEVRINNCTLDHGRRQGISITSAGKVLIENCVISNVGGTNPEYAIDVEPNANDTIESVIIRNVKSINCKGGYIISGIAKKSLIKNVEFYDCYVEGATKPEYYFYKSENIKMVNCFSDRGTKPINKKCKFFYLIE